MGIKKILITGGAGFIGSNLATALISKGYSITVFDNLSPQIHGNDPEHTSPLYQSVKDKVNFIKGTVESRDDWEKAIGDNEVIVHLAAETGTGQSMYQISRYADVNIGGTALMLDILANEKTQVQKVVVASSRAIYGEGKYITADGNVVYPDPRSATDLAAGYFEVKHPSTAAALRLVATDEDAKIHPTSVYGITKQNQEQMVLTVCAALGIAAVAYRYQNVYGPGQSLSNPYTGILSIFSTQIKNNKDINIFEDGKESRDFVFIDDVVNATILGIEREQANDQVFNVGFGVPVSVWEVASTLKKNYHSEVKLNITGNFRIGDIRHNYADVSKIKSLLNFTPQTDFEKGIGLFTQWVDQQQVIESRYEHSLDEMKKKGLLK
jgi:dTDP-L-rhamnose 4-epimerase